MNRANQSRTAQIRGVIYAGVVVINLCVIAALWGQDFTTPYQVLVMMTGLAAYIVFRRFPLTTPWNPGRSGSIGTGVIYSWGGIVGVILLTGYVTKYSSYFTRSVLLLWFMTTPLVLVAMHTGLMGFLRRFAPTVAHRRTAVIVFVNDTARLLARNLAESQLYELVGVFDDRGMERVGGAIAGLATLGGTQDAARYISEHGIETVFVVMPDEGSKRALGLFDELGDTTASVYYVPDFLIFNLLEGQVREVEGVPMLEVTESPFYGVDGLLKRGFDLLFATIVLLLLSPLMLLVALLIKLTSPGPVIYRQKRYGLNGQRFWVYKFRSMLVGEEAERDELQVSRNDSRITPLGRFLRRTSLDELPQFFNVLRGEMSVVGPRPHSVAHNERYRKAVKRYMVRHKVRPGLTGWAQVHGLRGEVAQLDRMEERIRYDLEYIRNWSPWFDIKIIVRTVLLVFSDKNAF